MEVVLAIAAVGVGLYFIIRWGVRQHRRSKEIWRATAADLGFEVVAKGRTIRGPVRRERPGAPQPVEVNAAVSAIVVGKTPMLQFAVGGGRLPSFTLAREGVIASVSKALGGEDVEVGDATFDGAWRLRGDEAEILASMDAHARQVLMANPKDDIRLKKGKLYRITGYKVEQAFIIGYVGRLSEVGVALTIPGSIPARLAHNAARDPVAAVRRRNLEVLLGRFPGAPEAAAAVRTALSDADPTVRLAGARAAGEGGFETLAALIGDRTPVAKDAARALASFAPERAGPVLVEALDGAAPLAVAAAAGLRALAHAPAAEALHAALDRAEPGVHAAVGRALADVCDGSFEPTLVALLADPELQEHAARGLGRIGGRDAVAPLRELERDAGGDVRRAAREAIASIQSRLEGAAAGQLSFMADGSAGAGALSPADDATGALSLEPE